MENMSRSLGFFTACARRISVGVDVTAGEQATWGGVGHESHVVVGEDPPKWLDGLEEGARAMSASDPGTAPCTMDSNDGSRSSLEDSREGSF
jgi:hypothetical protein